VKLFIRFSFGDPYDSLHNYHHHYHLPFTLTTAQINHDIWRCVGAAVPATTATTRTSSSTTSTRDLSSCWGSCRIRHYCMSRRPTLLLHSNLLVPSVYKVCAAILFSVVVYEPPYKHPYKKTYDKSHPLPVVLITAQHPQQPPPPKVWMCLPKPIYNRRCVFAIPMMTPPRYPKVFVDHPHWIIWKFES